MIHSLEKACLVPHLTVVLSSQLPAAVTLAGGGDGPGCLQAQGPRLIASKLAQLDARFGELPPGVDFGYSPAPGERRTIPLPNGQTVCIERAMSVLKKSAIESALEFPDDAVHADVLDFPTNTFPVGTLRFPRSGVAPPVRGADTVLWRGSVEYEPGRTAAVWARVRLSRRTKCLKASTPIRAGGRISFDAFEAAACDAAAILSEALGPEAATLQGQAHNLRTARTIRKGEWLTEDMFSEAAPVAARRQAVLEVYSGGARLSFPVMPEEDGSTGARIWVRSTVTRERLQARVAGVDRLVLTLPGRESISATRGLPPPYAQKREVAR
ncbi:MAG: flagella basal body P-ring formation protein FlgA [Bryobacterales bacterium]|nr:flagella basal body P-ring formation protein FlgA [Bryobacterales bacterium]